MTAQDRATPRDADLPTDRADQQASKVASIGAMSLQSGRGHEAAPQAFVRLTGSHLAKPRVPAALSSLSERTRVTQGTQPRH
ncbi:hypothetical protein ABIF65_002280 [Bradyrhizobium japonicum]|jgi:hypothetical protein|uniref:hypothetical protein n=1 Tax=Bradyrhizobium TaxID=374 RepID=UPI00041DBF58|nr:MULTISPECIES: hypothetical protein [Bradyrhizobium]MBR0878445.1 hypothetical protein [Bradyrhizobium liaoningense]MBR0940773.1 hypothetical protein [Bradyrhizobium liaoningense]MBR0998041.1 hypothetical protein [Bradyrhizobium liaoningense]MBR1031705.1 hypothetical protein [Bradyrhizobium liaoningense]MBR1069105.1 hypothetical protein [Bradyrhizobium liaoningense]